MGVSHTAPAALRENEGLLQVDKIVEDIAAFNVANNGAHRQVDGQIFTVVPAFQPALTGSAVVGFILFFELKMIEGAFVGCGPEDYIAAFAATATVRPTTRDGAFAPKTDATSAPLAGLNDDSDFINEFHAA